MKKRQKTAPARRPPSPAAKKPRRTRGQLISPTELERLQDRLRELTETVDALRTGAVDAVVVSGPNGNQIYSLVGAEHPYRIYVERMQEGAVTVSAGGVILYTNQHFADMLKLPLEQVIGSDIRAHIGAGAWDTISTVLAPQTEPVKHAGYLDRDDAVRLPVNLSASGLHLDDQEMVCLVVTDLTAQHETNRLRTAKEVAEKASLNKDAFLAALSHELRTPLTPALMAATTLANDPALPEHLRNEVAVVRRNVELEARLIDDLLDLTRITQDKLELHPAQMDVHEVLADAFAICQADIAAKKIDVRVNKLAEATQTAADAIRIEQVLWNLLRNAVKFTPEGGSIVIRTSNPAPDRVTIDVTDTGIGFDGATREKLFVAFEQGSREITRQFGGLGLGLTISRSIAEAHGGTINAVSEGPGQGARFTLELPLRPAAAAEAPAAPTPGPQKRRKPASLRILLVEDHRDTRNVLERVLRNHHHQVWAASDAKRALEIAGQQQLDVVISDLGLPDLSGLELMENLRDRFGLTGIAVSGYGMEEDVAKSHAAGFTHHLTKPISVERLRYLVSTIDATPRPVESETQPA